MNGQRSSMYTAEASIDAKVKGARGWRDFLGVIGFRLQKATNGLPDSVFFPAGASAAEVLATASNNLHALLGKFLFILFKILQQHHWPETISLPSSIR